MKASEKLCAKSFLRADLRCILECMKYIASHFVGCFSKVEDDVVYYNGADQKKNRSLAECFSFSLFLTLL